MAYAPTLTTYLDAAPCPRVEVFFDAFAPGTATVTVYRSAGRREHEVRGAIRVKTVGTLTRIDFECPFNMRVSYRAEMFDAVGSSLGFTDAAVLDEVVAGMSPEDDLLPDDDLLLGEVTVGVGLMSADSWMHNPLDPQGAVKVVATPNAAATISRPVSGTISRPLGRHVGVMLSQGRSGVVGFNYDVYVDDLASADKLQDMLGDYTRDLPPVLCLRTGGGESVMRIPQPLFLGVMDIVEEDINVKWGGSVLTQRITGDEVAPPAPGIFIPLLTRADIDAYFSTRSAIDAAHLRRTDIDRRYDLAGYATGGL